MTRRAWAWVAVISVASGCATPSSTQMPPSAGSVRPFQEDACAGRLHDLSEALLLFYLRNGELPDTLAQLKGASDPTLVWDCPITHKPYVYDRVGYYDMQSHKRVVMFDATPAHYGMRWAIQIAEPKDRKQALVAEVVLKPESLFIMRPPK